MRWARPSHSSLPLHKQCPLARMLILDLQNLPYPVSAPGSPLPSWGPPPKHSFSVPSSLWYILVGRTTLLWFWPRSHFLWPPQGRDHVFFILESGVLNSFSLALKRVVKCFGINKIVRRELVLSFLKYFSSQQSLSKCQLSTADCGTQSDRRYNRTLSNNNVFYIIELLNKRE